MHKRYPRYIIEVARNLRKRSTPAEKILWSYLRHRNLANLKFMRQFPIGRYVVDFYCDKLKLIVELEGEVHQLKEQVEYDKIRFEEFGSLGLNVFRFRNDEIFLDIEQVLRKIVDLKSKYQNRNQ